MSVNRNFDAIKTTKATTDGRRLMQRGIATTKNTKKLMKP